MVCTARQQAAAFGAPKPIPPSPTTQAPPFSRRSQEPALPQTTNTAPQATSTVLAGTHRNSPCHKHPQAIAIVLVHTLTGTLPATGRAAPPSPPPLPPHTHQ